MADYIDRQAAIDALKDMYHAAEKWGKEATDDVIKARAESCMASLIEMKLRIEKLPSVDAVEVVRCKDCVNCEYDSIFNQYWCGGSEVISDGFCNYGEREDPLQGAMNPPEDDITDGKGEAK